MLYLAREKQNSCVGEGESGIEGFGVAGQDIQRGPGIFNLSHVTDFPGSDTWEYLPNCSKDAATATFGYCCNRFVHCVCV